MYSKNNKNIAASVVALLTALLTLCPNTVRAEDVEIDGATFSNLRLISAGDSMTVAFDVRVLRDLKAHERMVFTPTIKDDKGSFLVLPKLMFNGRNQHIAYLRGYEGKEPIGVRRVNGADQVYSYRQVFPLSSWMKKAFVDIEAERCNCTVTLTDTEEHALLRTPAVTQLLPDSFLLTLLPAPEEIVKERDYKGQALITFEVDKWNLNTLYRDNVAQLNKIIDAMMVIKRDPSLTFKSLNLHGYASPEGTWAHNEMLAKNRVKTIHDYIVNMQKLPEGVSTIGYTPENWEGFRDSLLANPKFPHQAEFLAIVNNDKMQPDEKEAEMNSKFPTEYRSIVKEWFPALRITKFSVHYVARNYNKDEYAEVYKKYPQNLSIAEMYELAATYPLKSKEYRDILRTAVRLNPDSHEANFNMASYYVYRHEYDIASEYLENVKPCPEKKLLEGIIYVARGKNELGIGLIREAQSAGVKDADYYLK